jgi:putative transposase
MVKLTRKSDRRNIVAGRRTFFAGCKTYMDRPVFRAQNEAELFIDVLRTNTLAGKFKLHDFVVMPDHFHVLLTVDGNTSIERALQRIKGGYGAKSWGWKERSGRRDFPKFVSWTGRASWRIRSISMRTS